MYQQKLKSDSPIVKCSHCKQILSIADFESHKCDLPLTDIKQIPVIYFQDDSINGRKIMTGRGLDGTLYSFIVTQRIAIPFILGLSDDSYHVKPSDDKLPEPSTITFISCTRMNKRPSRK